MPPRPRPLPLLPLRAHPARPSTVAWGAGGCLFAYDSAAGSWELHREEAHTETVRALDATTVGAASGRARWVSAGDDKQVIIWGEGEGTWETVCSMTHSKKVTVALFDLEGRIIFGDRFGDVLRWDGREDAEAVPLLSHLAIVTAMSLTVDGRFLITADNHEKVRVSHYPQAAEIYSFCLGHTAQITAVLPWGEGRLLSAAADGCLRLWTLAGEPAASPGDAGAPVVSLCLTAAGEAAVACDGPVGIRKLRVSEVDGAAALEVNDLDSLPAGELPQAVCALLGSSAPAYVDRRGHLRVPPASAGGPWGDVFEGKDLPTSLASLSKCAGGDGAEGAEEEAGEDADDDARKGQAKKRRA